MRIPVYAISLPVVLFLLAAICFLIYEESWRVDGKLCDHLQLVQMDDCSEGDTSDGYRNLCWVLIAISSVTVAGMACLLPGAFKGFDALQTASGIRGWNPMMFLCPLIGLVLVVVFYAYFVTLIVYQVSCGDYDDTNVPVLPQQQVRMWSFHPAERVLVFFSVGMILWWLSFITHFVEFVTASLTTKWSFYVAEPTLTQFRASLSEAFRYHIGSILLAAVLIPAGRFLRNLFVGIRSLLNLMRLERAGKYCLCLHELWFKYMTSNALAMQTMMGLPLIESAKKADFMLARQARLGPQTTLNQGDRLIWLSQLVIIMIGPDFVAYWVQHKALTFRDISTREITSVTAMAIYGLFLTWALAQLYGGIVRGMMYGEMMSRMLKEDVKPMEAKGDMQGPGMQTEGIITNRDLKVTPRDIAEVQKVIPRGHDVTADMQGELVPPPSPKHRDESDISRQIEATPGQDEAIQS